MQRRGGGIAVRVFAAVVSALPACPGGAEIAGTNEAAETRAATHALDARIVANGASVTSGNACHRLRATLGEPLAGYATSASHTLSAGFRAGVRHASGDDVFFSGFEVCR